MGVAAPWSYSKLSLYKKCPSAFKFRYVDKIRTPTGDAAERGIRIHADLEDFIKWKDAFDCTAQKPQAMTMSQIGIKPECSEFFENLRYAFMYGLRGAEGSGSTSTKWSECVDVECAIKVDDTWALLDSKDKNYWGTFIFDIIRYQHKEVRLGDRVIYEKHEDPNAAEIIDIKTGKVYDNHRDQAITYALAYWKLTGFNPPVSFIYVDQGEIVDFTFSEEELAKEEISIRNLLEVIDLDDQFLPCESYMCRWCDYRRSGHCI